MSNLNRQQFLPATPSSLEDIARSEPDLWWHTSHSRIEDDRLRSADEISPGRYEAGKEWKGEFPWVSKKPEAEGFVYGVEGTVAEREYPGDPDARQLSSNRIVHRYRIQEQS